MFTSQKLYFFILLSPPLSVADVTKLYLYTMCVSKHKLIESKDGGEIDGSRVYFPLHMGETPSQSTEEQSEQPTVPQHI